MGFTAVALFARNPQHSSLCHAAARASEGEQKLYVQKRQGYSMQLPSSWTAKEKAGADVLFQNPARSSTNAGVTVSPVRVRTIGEFGDVNNVGEKLLQAERNKESTLGVEMLYEDSRILDSGSVIYNYEYELDSTRGRKRIINAVSIKDSKLYIFNAQHKCAKEGCTEEDKQEIDVLQGIAKSFSIQ